MSKRFTDSAKWGDPWFSDLPPLEKLFWTYLLDNCDHAGIWKVHMKLAAFHLGCEPSLEPFEGRYLQLTYGTQKKGRPDDTMLLQNSGGRP